MSCTQFQFCTFIVTGRCPDSANRIAINRHSFYVQFTAPNAFIRFSGFADTQNKSVADYLIRIKASDRITKTDRYQIYKVYQCIYLIE